MPPAGSKSPTRRGLRSRLTQYGDDEFSLYLRKAFIKAAGYSEQEVIRPLHRGLRGAGSLSVLNGNLCPRGAIIKHSAASPGLLQHTGRAVVFESLADLTARIDDPTLDVEEGDVLVLRNAGPVGAPGMPEAGYIPIPKKLSADGVKDMVRISDARMSGTAFGTVVLHVAPEAAVGGPLSLVRNGDLIRLDHRARRVDLLVADEVLRLRSPAPVVAELPQRGYAKLFHEHVLQADEGCDFRFLTGDPLAERRTL